MLIKPYEGVIAAETGHISVHEVGAIEFSGHKVLTLKYTNGKINYHDIQQCIKNYYTDQNKKYMKMPGLV